MGVILWYVFFCGLVIVGVVVALAAGLPLGLVGQLGVWTVSVGAIVAVVLRFLRRRG